MAIKVVGFVTDMIYGANDPTKLDINVVIVGLISPGIKTSLVWSDVPAGEGLDAFLTQALKDHAQNAFGYTLTLDEAKVLWSKRVFSIGSASRSLNSAYQISAERDTLVNYSVDISTTLSLTGGQTGTVFLEYADNSGMTTNVVEVCRFVNGNTGTLTIGLNITQNSTGQLSGVIPAGKYARIRTANTTGTPTFTYRSGQEALV